MPILYNFGKPENPTSEEIVGILHFILFIIITDSAYFSMAMAFASAGLMLFINKKFKSKNAEIRKK
jgi:hypothetical protein